MINLLAKHITKFFSNLIHNILVLIILSIISIPVLISWFTGTLDLLLQKLKTPVPIWGIIILALLVFIYLKIKKDYSSSKSEYKTKYFTIDKYKWKVKIYNNEFFDVDKYPFCTIHDMRFIYESGGKHCPGLENETCAKGLSEHDEFKVYESAKSIIENKIRNKKY